MTTITGPGLDGVEVLPWQPSMFEQVCALLGRDPGFRWLDDQYHAKQAHVMSNCGPDPHPGDTLKWEPSP